jgi:hypothetical protein
MKEHNEVIWDSERLQSLITNRIEENFNLEYKGSKAIREDEKGKTEITKDVSAFANSDGGTIIYGITEHSDSTLSHTPEKIDPLSRKRFAKEWLEHVISNIRPAIPDLRIYPIQISDEIDQVVYVVEIPKSSTAHQALDCRYYRRYNFESKPMQDYEIRDIMNRVRFAVVTAKASFSLQDSQTKGCLHFEVTNESDILVRHFAAIIYAPMKWRNVALVFDDAVMSTIEGMNALKVSFDNGGRAPLFPKSTRYHNFKCDIRTFKNEPKNLLSEVRYKLYADSAPFVAGTFTLDSIFNK